MKSAADQPENLVEIEQRGMRLLAPREAAGNCAGLCSEDFSLDLLAAQLSPGCRFVDIGAGYGLHVLTAALARPEERHCALGMTPVSHEILRKNLERTGASNVELPAADPQSAECASLLEKMSPGFMRISAEGLELRILNNLRSLLSRNPGCRLMVRLDPPALSRNDTSVEELLALLQEMRFEVYFCDDGRRRLYRLDYGGIAGWQSMLDGAESLNLFCIPAEKSLYVGMVSHLNGIQGAERSLIATAECLATHGAFCEIILPGPGPLDEKLRHMAVSVQYEKGASPWIANAPEGAARLRLAADKSRGVTAAFKRSNPHVIFSSTSVIISGALAAAVLDKPHVWSLHEYEACGLRYLLDLPARCELVNRLSNHVIFNSRNTADVYTAIDPSKSSVIYQPILVDTADAPSPQRCKGGPALIHLGAVREQKGQIDAVLAMERIVQDFPDACLKIVGKVDQPAYLERLKICVAEKKLEKNEFFLPATPDPYSLMREADLILFCSRDEPFGRIPVEGMLLGKVVVMTDSGAAREIISDKEDGFLYEPGDAAALAATVIELLNSPEKMARISAIAREAALRKFPPDDLIRKELKILYEAKKAKNPCSLGGSDNPVSGLLAAAADAWYSNLSVALKKAEAKLTEREKERLRLLDELGKRRTQVESWKAKSEEAGQKVRETGAQLGENRKLLAALQSEFSEAQKEIFALKREMGRKSVKLALKMANSRLAQSKIARSVKDYLK